MCVNAIGGCSCSNHISFSGYGNCQQLYEGRPLCYVNEPSACSDLRDSNTETEGIQWSFEACGNGKMW